jgi:hypothetical protein
VPRSLGPAADRFVIPPGGVCDPCNHWLGAQVDTPFVDRFDMRLTRALEGLRGRRAMPYLIESLDATMQLGVELEGGTARIQAARADPNPDGGLDIEIRPKQRDPADVVACTIRALWKIALGALWLLDAEAALDPSWDDLRCGVLGYPFRGYLLQRPFQAMVLRRIDVSVNPTQAESPMAMTFVCGGVVLAVPLAQGATVTAADVEKAGWEIHLSGSVAPNVVRLRVDPSE